MTRVLVVGLRATGEAVVRFATGPGGPAAGDAVTVVEERPVGLGYEQHRAIAVGLGAEVVENPTAHDWPALVARSDLVVLSPGVRPDHPVFAAAAAAGVPVRGDVDLGVEQATAPVVAVTGTNGKSTVTTLIAAMLRASGRNAVVAGNIGRPLLDALDDPADVYVVELSSFQLFTTTSAFRPRVAVLLNIAPDHLDWHGGLDAYIEAKARVFEHLGPDDLLVYGADDEIVAGLVARAKSRTVGFTAGSARPGVAGVLGGNLVSTDGAVLAALEDLPHRAPHDVANAAAAATAAVELGATPEGVQLALRNFRRLHHRTESVGKADGVSYVDDSKATNPHAVLAALAGYDHVVLLAGGDSKGVDLTVLRSAAERLRAVVAIGKTPEEVEEAFAGFVPTARAATMHAAVRVAADLARPGDTVLLSPACASFDWYQSYEERGQDFRREVTTLIAERERV